MTLHNEWQFNTTGWPLLTVTAVFFAWAALHAGDWISAIANLLFLIA